MKHICLVTPPSEFLLDERVFPALGILKIGGVLERAGHSVDHLDLAGVKNYEEVVTSYAAETHCDTYAITATSPQMPAASRIAKALAIFSWPQKLILGGPHSTLTFAAAKLERKEGREGRAIRSAERLLQEFDVVVGGDGEKSIFQALRTGKGYIDADDPGSALWMAPADLEGIWPSRHLLDMGSYKYAIDGERATSTINQLGCPMACFFCAGRNSPMLRRMRLRTPEDAIAEIVHVYENYGIKGYMMLDDETNISKSMLPLMRGLKDAADARGIQWKLRGFIKSELFTEEQAETMYAAGFRQILVGFEAGHERILANIHKNATVEENTRCMAIAHKYGLKVKALMSIGHCGETEETVLAVRDWLLEVRPSDFDVTVITPYPGSPYYDKAIAQADGSYCYTDAKTGDQLFMDDVDFSKEAQFYKGQPGSYVSHVWTPGIGRERIVQLRDQVEAEVREKLGIPFYQTGASLQFESSMGQTKIPAHILRSSQ